MKVMVHFVAQQQSGIAVWHEAAQFGGDGMPLGKAHGGTGGIWFGSRSKEQFAAAARGMSVKASFE